jgi:hypothetical protein
MIDQPDPSDDPPPSGPPTDDYRLVSEGGEAPSETQGIVRGSGGLIFVYFGIVVLLAGIFALVAASIEASGVASFNSACAMNPLCTPAPNYSGEITAVGVLLLVVALILFGLAYRAYQNPK